MAYKTSAGNQGCCGKKIPYCNEPTQEQLDMEEQKYCLDDFKQRIISNLTSSCALPFAIPEQEVERIIDETKRWFYQNYEDAVEEQWLMLPYCELMKVYGGVPTQINAKRGKLKLPDKVVSVVGVYEMGNTQGEAYGHFLGQYPYRGGFLQSATSMWNSIPMVADNISYFTIMDSFFDLTRQLVQYPVSTRFNINTKNLTIMGHYPKNSLVLDVFFAIDDCSLFEDELFYRYVYAQCLIKMSYIMQRYSFNLPGGVTLNTDFGGEQMLSDVKQEIMDMRSASYFITT